MTSQQRQTDRDPATAPARAGAQVLRDPGPEPQRQPVGDRLQTLHRHVERTLRRGVGETGPVAQHPQPAAHRRRRHGTGLAIVRVHHREPAAGRGTVAAVEQHELGIEVALHRAMVVEMVVAQVGEHGDLARESEGAALHQGVAAHLDRHALDAALHHLAQQSVEFQGSRRGQGRRPGLVPDPDAGGADDAGAPAGGAEDGLQHPGGRGLAVGAGDADDPQCALGMAVKARGRLSQRPPRLLDFHHGLTSDRGPALHHHRGGSRLERLPRVAPAVLAQPGDPEEHRARGHPARVAAQPRDLAVGGPGDTVDVDLLEQAGERHGVLTGASHGPDADDAAAVGPDDPGPGWQ